MRQEDGFEKKLPEEKSFPVGKHFPEVTFFPLEKILPLHIRESLTEISWQEGLEEIRVRVGQPMEFFYGGGSRYLGIENGTCIFIMEQERWERRDLYLMNMQDIGEMMSYISNYSLYAYKEEIRQGYITIEGGHRVGLAGGVATEQGKLTGICHVSFLNIRIAHERRDCAGEILPYIRQKGKIYSTLLFSEPGAGKTTFLRDCIRLLSTGTREEPGAKVCVVDERSEIAACHLGIPQNDLGPRTDVLDGAGKADGMLMLLRSMSPQVLAVDELGGEADFAAVEQAVYAGCRVIGTVHAGSVEELARKPYLHRWVEQQVFQRYIGITRDLNGKRSIQVFDAGLELLC